MKKYIVSLSGGAGSYCAAKRTIEKHGKSNVELVFCDVLIEDEDLYRFLDDIERKLNKKIIYLRDGRSPWDVFRDVRFIGNSRIAPCSRILKSELFYEYIDKKFGKENVVIVLGIDWNEEHRLKNAKKRNPDWIIEAPLCEPPYLDKEEMLAILDKDGIKRPRLYGMGFPHNNCGGGCIKAGLAQWKLLYEKMPERYAWFEERERERSCATFQRHVRFSEKEKMGNCRTLRSRSTG